VRLASQSDRIHGAGAEVIAVSTDDPERQAGMYARWPTPNVLYVADPGGARFLAPLDLFDPDERGGIGLPGMVVIAPDGGEAYRYVGRDFADRTTDEDVFAAVAALGLDAIEPPAGGPDASVSSDLDGYFAPTEFAAYFKGNRSASIAIARRSDDRAMRAIAREHRLMCEASLEAWSEISVPPD
jgi:hypothetical protein